MKYPASLIALTLLALALAGCSRHSQTAAFPKNNDLGVINVSDGKLSSHTLDDGRVCTITPAVLPNGNIKLTTTIIETNASGEKRSSLVFESPVNGQAYTFGFDRNTVLTVTLDDKDAVFPGRHMSESQVVAIAGRELPQTSGFRCEFKDGAWEVLAAQQGVWGVSSRTTNGDGKITVESTNATRVVLRVRDLDGKVEPVKTP